MDASTHRPTWKTLLAFGIIYFVWGSTFLAIRVGVHEVPPLLLAAMRFFVAGLVLFGWTMARGERGPSGRQWLSVSVLALLIFLIDYGLLFWAEQRVPSGLAAVMLATIPAFMALSEIVFLRTQRLTVRLAAALLIGLGGVGVLVSRSLDLGGAPIDRLGAAALIFAAISWSIASALASGALGEFRDFHPRTVSRGAWFSLVYLIVAGSIIGFTAYVWLLHHESPTKVGTYAYVNPMVAVVLGYFLGDEALGARTIVGSLCVLISVVVITTTRAKKAVAAALVEETG
jgi:drug/metabolite transporter (DMT)-like permease